MKTIEVVCGIIQVDGKYFIARRSGTVDQGYWEFPGGKVETNETKEQAIQRELREELQIETNIIKELISIDDVRLDRIIHVTAFLCELVSGTPTLSVHDAMNWVFASDLYNYPFQPADQPILDALQKE